MRHADYIVDIGPGAGEHGGEIVAAGTAKHIMQCPALHHRRVHRRPRNLIEVPAARRKTDKTNAHGGRSPREQPARTST